MDLNGSVIECGVDKRNCSSRPGECLSQPEGKHLRSYRVRVDKEDIFVGLGQSLASKSEKEIEAGSRSFSVMRGRRTEGFTERFELVGDTFTYSTR